MDWFSRPDLDASVLLAWEHLISGDALPQGELRGVVDDSWRRCLDGHVDPRADGAPTPPDNATLDASQAKNVRLLDASIPLIEQTRDFLAQTGTIMLLADPDGMILQLEGDTRIVEPAGEVRLVPGCNWTELNCGTNAIGTALALQQPVQIHGAEHFCAGIKRWTCSATVIRDPLDRRVLGVIDVSGLADTYSRHSLALAVSMAGRIESRLAKLLMERRLRLLDRCAVQFGAGRNDAVLVADEHGRLVKANQHAAPMLAQRGVAMKLGDTVPIASPEALSSAASPALLPEWLRDAHIETMRDHGDTLGFLIVFPAVSRRLSLKTADDRLRERAVPAFARIIGNSPALLAALEKAEKLAPAKVPVLLLGETGVGKELFAQAIHQSSSCASGPFVALNCGGLSRDLLASELFGYAEGAFTGARKSGAAGKIEAANGGTLFLDEIGEMPIDIQPHLLRVLEEGEIYRLGENTPRKVNIRLVAATHRNLRDDVAQGKFRMDLFYRIAVTNISIPALRERKDDIPALVAEWLKRLCERYGTPPAAFDDEASRRLVNYNWPGNIRELRNAVESALLMAQGSVIRAEDLPPEIATEAGHGAHVAAPASLPPVAEGICSLESAEAASISAALSYSAGNLTKAAARLGIAKSTLYEKIRKYGLSGAVTQTRGLRH
ncbi:Fis family transcriptional regulator [Noviherbaspirillum denitrificans]|uniref:Fis family transcriptional regulator n=2 Tax=Noviherbaspirillum denitrificans TaxID=1968433 RepID=A0A254TCR9_9BURK|nr:Fis family transcriptional regulator [Noviherbaspirillum denitrificans]